MSRRMLPPGILFVLGLALPLVNAEEDKKPLLTHDRPIEQAIDHYVDAAQREAKIKPAPLVDDAALLRRLTLDLVGRIPTLSEQEEYLRSTDPARKTQLVDRLLASPGFARHQAQEFAALLQYQEGRRGKTSGMPAYLLAAFRENRGWDRIFRDILLPDDDDPAKKGAGDFLKARVKDLDRLTIDVSTLFFGVNVSCAQCHDHPHVPAWTQDHFYGLKSFFARSVDVGGFLGEKDFGVVKYVPNKGKEKVAPVMFLTGKSLDVPGVKDPSGEERKKEQERIDGAKKAKKAPAPPSFSLRAKLVETALAPDGRTFFSRAAVNRLYHRLIGRGLVMPLDQMHLENPASHPDLLAWLARDLETHDYDLTRLVRGIVLSSTYARASRWDGEETPEDRWYAVANVRPLTPLQMAASLKVATLNPTSLPTDPKDREKKLEEVVASAERLSIYFPQPGVNFQVGVAEAMLFANNETLSKELLEGPDTLITRLLGEGDLKRRAELAVRCVLGRAARQDEIEAMANYLQRRAERPEAGCRQVVWALLTSAEFRFNH